MHLAPNRPLRIHLPLRLSSGFREYITLILVVDDVLNLN